MTGPGAAHTGLASNSEFANERAAVHRRWSCTLVLQGEGNHRQQAIEVPAIKSDGSLARVRLKASAMSTVKRFNSRS